MIEVEDRKHKKDKKRDSEGPKSCESVQKAQNTLLVCCER